MRACAGLIRPASGRVLIGDRDVTYRPYRDHLAEGIAYLPAGRLEEGLIPGLTIREHVVLARRGPQPFFINWPEADREAQSRIRTYQIRGEPSTPVEALSGGNQQRTLLALLPPALRLLFLEHPTRGLDIESTMWVWEQLLHRREEGTTIFFTSSDLDELMAWSDRIMVFFGGRVLATLTTKETTVEQLGYLIGGKEPVPRRGGSDR